MTRQEKEFLDFTNQPIEKKYWVFGDLLAEEEIPTLFSDKNVFSEGTQNRG